MQSNSLIISFFLCKLKFSARILQRHEILQSDDVGECKSNNLEMII